MQQGPGGHQEVEKKQRRSREETEKKPREQDTVELSLKQRYILLAAIGASCILVDQLTKVWARSVLRSPEAVRYVEEPHDKKKDAVRLWERRIEFRLSYNKGSAFGMFNRTEGARWWLVLVGLAALGLIGYLLHRPEGNSKLFVIALSLVAGGAVGNLIDRILFGRVTDFIVVWVTESISWTNPWPSFNIADSVLVIGVGLMIFQIIYSMFYPPKEEDTDPEKGKGKEKKKDKGEDKDKSVAKNKDQDKTQDSPPNKPAAKQQAPAKEK